MLLDPVELILKSFWNKFTNFLPDLIGGLVILLIGLICASLLKKFLETLIKFLKIESFFKKIKLLKNFEWQIWSSVLIEISRWIVILLFLIPTLETWGLSKATVVINQFLFYLPNIIIAIIITFIGLVIANLSHDLVRNGFKTLGAKQVVFLSSFAKVMIIFFTALVVLNQLGVAQDLVRILFTGIVAMIAIAGGLAFGLGGKDLAKNILEKIRENLKEK